MNIQRLLVPLDGSDLAEVVLAPAAFLARACGAALVLLHVVEQAAPQRIHGGSRHITREEEATEYLRHVAGIPLLQGIRVDIHVHSAAVRDVAASIAQHIRECEIDAIIMCVHGRGNPRRWLLGNNAQQILTQGGTPIFFIPAFGKEQTGEFSIQTILLPLDGKPEHEQSVIWAEQMAHACRANLELIMVVPTPESLSGEQAATRMILPVSTAAILDISAESAEEYLARHAEPIRAKGYTVSSCVLRGDPAEELARRGNEFKSGLMVLGTHGRAGNAAFWNRSVTARVLHNISSPLLLIPVKNDE